MAEGTVKWFNAVKGFGMIVPDDLSANVFVHFSSIEGSGHGELAEGQRVSFDAVPAPKGPRTTRVRTAEVSDQHSAPHRPHDPVGGEDV